jgi:ABC-type Mn2+/Zn2+ transport system permease subunit
MRDTILDIIGAVLVAALLTLPFAAENFLRG